MQGSNLNNPSFILKMDQSARARKLVVGICQRQAVKHFLQIKKSESIINYFIFAFLSQGFFV